MNTSHPLVSILVPTYNEEIYILECLTSILNQDYPNFEVIVFDDCSKDNTVKIIESIKDSRLTLFKNHKNEKHDKTWAQLLLMAKGTYIKMLCADDSLAPNCISESVKALESRPDCIMAFCGKNIIDPKGRTFYSPLATEKSFENMTGHQIIRLGLLRGTNLIGEPNNVLFRSIAVEKGARFRFKNYWMVDPDFYIQLAPLGNFVFVPKRLTSFRISLKSWSVLYSFRQAKMFRQYITREDIQAIFHFNAFEVTIAYLNALKLQFMRQAYYLALITRSSIATILGK